MKGYSKDTIKAFFVLLQAGLWEKEVRLAVYGDVDYAAVYRLASEQSVVGLLAAGLEHVVDVKIPQELALIIAGEVLQLEQRNKAMNEFIASLVNQLRDKGINTLLVKGQGIAECYERPLWRACGDVDLFMDDENYVKAAQHLSASANEVVESRRDIKHIEMTIGPWSVELHGTLRSQLGKRVDGVIDVVQNDTFEKKHVRIWHNATTDVLLPSADNDVIFVFTHILQHFFNGGIGLRQICDWCRLLWVYRSSIDDVLLKQRISEAGLMSEWRAFSALAVEWLDMPAEASPLYSGAQKWKEKADKIVSYVLKTGNMGHNRDTSYREKFSTMQRKLVTLARISGDGLRQFGIFPKDAIRVWWLIVTKGVNEAVNE